MVLSSLVLFVVVYGACGETSKEQSELTKCQVELTQKSAVTLGGEGEFEVRIEPEGVWCEFILQLQTLTGTGAAEFEDGTTRKSMSGPGTVKVRGVIANDVPGGVTLTAISSSIAAPWPTAFFDVVAPTPAPRIFFRGRDITGETVQVVMGQQMLLSVTLHPSLEIRTQSWKIEDTGEYVGGFVHTPLHGGPQPVVLMGPTALFYWVRRGEHRKVTYTLALANGETAMAGATFDVSGPGYTRIESDPLKVILGPGIVGKTEYMVFAGTGISFDASYSLEPGLLRNYTWVQLISSDRIVVKSAEGTLRCVPKSQPVAEFGAGLDSSYPYDTHNPTRDSPPTRLTEDSDEIARSLRAKMYLLWSPGLSNSIAVPLGYVSLHFSGHAVRKEGNQWKLKSGSGGPDEPEQVFRETRSYPLWESLVPYTGVLTCE
jgi:hypothetical protein